MTAIEQTVYDFRRFDLLASGDSMIHRLDGRAKVLVTLVFSLTVVSFDRYTFSALLPFLLFPVVITVAAALPTGFMLRKTLLVALLALAIGIGNPLFDREIRIWVGEIGISGGWLSSASLLFRSFLTISAALLLIATTRFTTICTSLERLGLPAVLVRQFQLMYRYLFVLADETIRVLRARELRSSGRAGGGLRAFSSLVGHLLLRSWERSERLHLAMLCRGGYGSVVPRRPDRFDRASWLYLLGWLSCFVLFRLYDLPQAVGGGILLLYR